MSGLFAAKFTFVFINLIFLLSGITLTVIAALGQSNLKYFADALNIPIFPSVTFVLAIGIIVIAISLLGLFAGCSERNCLLTVVCFVYVNFEFALQWSSLKYLTQLQNGKILILICFIVTHFLRCCQRDLCINGKSRLRRQYSII